MRCLYVHSLKEAFPWNANARGSLCRSYSSPCTRSHEMHRTVRSGRVDGTKDHDETKAQMTPSCDSPSCSFLPLSDIKCIKKKRHHLIEQPLPIFVCVKGELKTDNNLCVSVFPFVAAVYACVCVKPLPRRDALFKMLLWYLCLLKGLSFLLTPCRIGPPLAPLVGRGTRVGPAGSGPHHLGKYHSRGRKGNDLDNLWVWRTFLRT